MFSFWSPLSNKLRGGLSFLWKRTAAQGSLPNICFICRRELMCLILCPSAFLHFRCLEGINCVTVRFQSKLSVNDSNGTPNSLSSMTLQNWSPVFYYRTGGNSRSDIHYRRLDTPLIPIPPWRVFFSCKPQFRRRHEFCDPIHDRMLRRRFFKGVLSTMN